MLSIFFRLLTELSSRKFIARLAGQFAKSSLSKKLIPQFAKTYGIRIEDAEKKLSDYTSLNEFFTRRLKPGLRPIHTDEHTCISPVDGTIIAMGTVRDGETLNIKGQNYTVKELLNESPRMINYKHGYFFVIYLSPKDYHRIHAPVTGKILEKERITGKVYPVHQRSLTHIRQVLSRNERLITYIQHAFGEIAMVKVGAMNVASIQYTDPDREELNKGDELAYFEFGSTVVLLMESGTFTALNEWKVNDSVMMGQPLGLIHEKHDQQR